MQISVSIDSDRTRNGQPPQILGAIGHPRYNGISELTDFVITGLHCIRTSRLCPWVYWRCVCHMDISHFRQPDCATDKKYLSLIGRSQNSSLNQNSTYSIQWLTLRQEFMYVYLTYFRSACRKSWFLYRTAALCENVGARNLIGRMKHIVGYLGI